MRRVLGVEVGPCGARPTLHGLSVGADSQKVHEAELVVVTNDGLNQFSLNPRLERDHRYLGRKAGRKGQLKVGEETDTSLSLEGRGRDASLQRRVQSTVLGRGAGKERVERQVEGRAAMEGQEEGGHGLPISGEQPQRIVGIVVGSIVEGPAQGLFWSVQGFTRRPHDERMQCGQP